MKLSRRSFVSVAVLSNVAPFATSSLLAGRAHAQDTTIKVGALRTISAISQFMYERFQPPGMKIEIVAFASPADCKNALVSKSIDFAGFGVAAAISGAANGEPVSIIGGLCDGGMAVVAKKDLPIAKIADLKGRKVAIWPGSTQEIFLFERLKMEGLSKADITPVRIFFSEMHAALARGDVDAYIGAEPAPAISVTSGVGKIVEYPYSTPMGALNVIFATRPDHIKERPALVRAMMKTHRQASEFCMSSKEETVQAAMKVFSMQRDAVEASFANIMVNWRLSPELIQRATIYSQHMLDLRQIRQQPDLAALMQPSFSRELA